jgi:uncharacterized protein (DUF697 family)
MAKRARKTREAEFLALLRRQCVRAAGVGALTAATERIPGMGRALGLVFGEIVDAQFLATIQRELVEETFRLYRLELPAPLHKSLVRKVQLAGTGASATGDAMMRRMFKSVFGRTGGLIARRVLPIASIISSAGANAMVTYAIGKRAQAVARLRQAPVAGMPDVLRAFTGIDERRVFAWSLAAVNASVGAVGRVFGRTRERITPARRRKRARA